MALEQEHGAVSPLSMARYVSESCSETGRSAINQRLEEFRREFRLGEPVAANYFTVQHDSFVDGINTYCQNKA